MAIYARCPLCRRDNPATSKVCTRCKSKLSGKYLVKIKDSPITQASERVETKLKVQLIEGQLFNKQKKGSISFVKYPNNAKLEKKSWKAVRCNLL